MIVSYKDRELNKFNIGVFSLRFQLNTVFCGLYIIGGETLSLYLTIYTIRLNELIVLLRRQQDFTARKFEF